MPGRRPWKVGTDGLVGEPPILVLASGHGRWDGVALASCLLRWRCGCCFGVDLLVVQKAEFAEGYPLPFGQRHRRLRTSFPS